MLLKGQTIKIRAGMQPWENHINLYLYAIDMEQKKCWESEIKLKEVNEGAVLHPILTFHDKEPLQGLMDSLWDCGIRPTEGTGSAGSLKATQNHLEDMRKLVLKNKYVKL